MRLYAVKVEIVLVLAGFLKLLPVVSKVKVSPPASEKLYSVTYRISFAVAIESMSTTRVS